MSDTHKTKGSDFRLQKFRSKYDMRKFYFTNRVVDVWNSLPNWAVSANSVVMTTELLLPPRWLATNEPTSPLRCFTVFPAVFLSTVS